MKWPLSDPRRLEFQPFCLPDFFGKVGKVTIGKVSIL